MADWQFLITNYMKAIYSKLPNCHMAVSNIAEYSRLYVQSFLRTLYVPRLCVLSQRFAIFASPFGG